MSWTQGTEDWGACGAAFAELGLGLNVSKANAYGVLSPPAGASVSKANIYSVLSPLPAGINVSKAVVYSVLNPVVSTKTRPLVNPPIVSGLIEGGLIC
jgi:hypothetical protein